MHPESMAEMSNCLRKWPGSARVLDVGSFNVNGSYRDLIERKGWEYTGLDIRPGPNVDIVTNDPVKFPLEDASFDIVISGSTLEHVERPWEWMPEVARLLRPQGLLVVITHTSWQYHPTPQDFWRFLPDGMRFLFDTTGCLNRYDISMYCSTDIRGLAYKV